MHPHFLVGLYEEFHERVLGLPAWLMCTAMGHTADDKRCDDRSDYVSLSLALLPSFSQLDSASSAGMGADVHFL